MIAGHGNLSAHLNPDADFQSASDQEIENNATKESGLADSLVVRFSLSDTAADAAADTGHSGDSQPASRSAWLIARAAVGSILLFAATAKWTALWGEPAVWRMLEVLAAAQAAIEVLLAVWLFSGIVPRLVHRLAIGLFLVFAAYSAWLVLLGVSTCGCFGNVRVPPLVVLALDLGVLAGLLGCPPPVSTPRIRLWPLVRASASGLGIAAAFAGVLLWASPSMPTPFRPGSDVRREILEPASWPGTLFPLLPQIATDAPLSSGDWIVVLHRPSCSSCRTVHEEYAELDRELRARSAGLRVAFVEVPWSGEQLPPRRKSAYALGRLSEDRQWFVETPVIVKLQNGRVLSVIEQPAPGSVAQFADPAATISGRVE
jgi:hypothetical protein